MRSQLPEIKGLTADAELKVHKKILKLLLSPGVPVPNRIIRCFAYLKYKVERTDQDAKDIILYVVDSIIRETPLRNPFKFNVEILLDKIIEKENEK